jgi:hypothetical protein
MAAFNPLDLEDVHTPARYFALIFSFSAFLLSNILLNDQSCTIVLFAIPAQVPQIFVLGPLVQTRTS